MKSYSDDHPCSLDADFKIYRDGIAKIFSRKTIKDLVEDIRTGYSFIKNIGGGSQGPALALPVLPL